MPGILWGLATELFTPAFWHAQAWFHELEGGSSRFALGDTLREEVAACLLGGWGIPAEVGLAAFYTVKRAGVLEERNPSATQIELLLTGPLWVGGKRRRYRFPVQKSRQLAACLCQLDLEPWSTHSHVELRDNLAKLPGIGLKTASWITRNHLGSNDVAILDVHVYRAGVLIGLFKRTENPASRYRSMEARFLIFAEAIDVPPSVLDAVIWQEMRRANAHARAGSHGRERAATS